MRSIDSILLAAAVLGLASPAGAQCETYIEPVTVTFTADEIGMTHHDVALLQPVSLEHVGFFGMEALTMTTTGMGSALCTIRLLSEGIPVGDASGAIWQSGSTSQTADTGFFIDPADQDAIVDAVRFSIQQTGEVTTMICGIHLDETVNMWFIVGGLPPQGPHQAVGLGMWDTVTVSGDDVTTWEEIDLPTPLAADALHSVARIGAHLYEWSGEISACIETQALFDNGVVLTMDDWSSPSEGQAPPAEEQWFSMRAFLAIDDDIAALIDGSLLTGLRWRCHAQGSGSATLSFEAEQTLMAFYRAVAEIPGDTNADAVVDVQDLTNVILDWGSDGTAHGGDVDGSGLVDVEDLTMVIFNWGPCV